MLEFLNIFGVFGLSFLLINREVPHLPLEDFGQEWVKYIFDEPHDQLQDILFPVELSCVLLIDLQLVNEYLEGVVYQFEELVIVLIIDDTGLNWNLKQILLNLRQIFFHLLAVQLH